MRYYLGVTLKFLEIFSMEDLKEYMKGFGIDISGVETMDELEKIWHQGEIDFWQIKCVERDGTDWWVMPIEHPDGSASVVDSDDSPQDVVGALNSLGYDVINVSWEADIYPDEKMVELWDSKLKKGVELKGEVWNARIRDVYMESGELETSKAITFRERLAGEVNMQDLDREMRTYEIKTPKKQ